MAEKKYIDRGALYEAMNGQNEEFSLIEALDMVESFPTADVAEIRHGNGLFETLESARAEAIKEFAERLKETFPPREDARCTLDDCYTLDRIDDLVKEMTEEIA